MKGVIAPDHIPVNKYSLVVIGLPPLTITEMTGIEEELETVDLPDRTVASGGNTKSIEFDMQIPMHHNAEQAAMEIWFRESQEPVVPSYKKAGTLAHISISGNNGRSFSLIGLFPCGRVNPDLEMVNEGEMATVTWKMKCDLILPL